MNLLDGNGRWTEGGHEEIMKSAISNLEAKGYKFSNEQKTALAQGMVVVDQDQTNQFKHVMRNPDETVEGNRAQLKKWKESNLNDFNNKDNWESLGKNLHSTSDAFAPSHAGWQVWHSGGVINPQNWPHIFGDLKDLNVKEFEKAIEAVTNELEMNLLKKASASQPNADNNQKQEQDDEKEIQQN